MSVAFESPCMVDMEIMEEFHISTQHSYREAEDSRLAVLAQAGDIAAFEEIVRRYRNQVFSLAFYFLHSREDAWDAAQEVFVKAFRSIGNFRGDASIKTWLLRIAANQCKDQLKRRKLDTVSLDGSVADSTTSNPALEPDKAACAKEIGEAILKVLDTVPVKQRTAFILREFEGLSYEQMSDVMGCNVGTVMSRLFHARKKIQDGLDKLGIV